MSPGWLTEKSPVLLISELDGSHPVNRILGCINLSHPFAFQVSRALGASASLVFISALRRRSGPPADLCPCRIDEIRSPAIVHLSQRRLYVL